MARLYLFRSTDFSRIEGHISRAVERHRATLMVGMDSPIPQAQDLVTRSVNDLLRRHNLRLLLTPDQQHSLGLDQILPAQEDGSLLLASHIRVLARPIHWLSEGCLFGFTGSHRDLSADNHQINHLDVLFSSVEEYPGYDLPGLAGRRRSFAQLGLDRLLSSARPRIVVHGSAEEANPKISGIPHAHQVVPLHESSVVLEASGDHLNLELERAE